MKSIIVILLILCVGLAGCNSTSTDTANSGSVIDLSSNLTNITDASNSSDVSSNVSEISHSSIPEETTGPEPEYFVFSCKSLEDFVLWSKTKGTVKVGLNSAADNPLNQTYLNWVKTQNSLLIPVLKAPLKTIGHIEPLIKRNGYCVNISMKETPKGLHDIMWLYIYSLSDDFQNHNLDYITDNWLIPEVYPQKKSATINKGNCVFGEYRYINSVESNQTSTSAWFVKNQYLIYISVIKYMEDFAADWQEEYFDYFDFETVSLK